ncbi:hypothetical protein JCM8115_003489 [Rhodotorula mucilaginosa]|uniref:Complex III subunit 7 n=1 Tax=Rhodotorula mucilaginosa TaxID=5537 RepID=A0A9P6VWE2_RHOMI|nr:Cytochrome b-c1 complex subunit 7 [Rhodotorula mucilaginosa]TKA50466.1 hypothetical protein B0A53_06136 [Rhodotorula sp. CCFEE 5036]
MSALGVSLFKQVKQSPGLYRFLKPLAGAYANLAGYRAHGLKYDDILIEENATVQKALARLDEREAYDRAYRLRVASMCAIAHEELPKNERVKPEEDVRYLKPYVEEIETEQAERHAYDNAKRV